MNNYPPHIEVIDDAARNPGFQHDQPWFRSRVLLFIVVFVVSAAGGLTYNFKRPAVYQSHATLLTSAMTAIDQVKSHTDIQHVEIQRHLLLGQELMEASRVRNRGTNLQAELPKVLGNQFARSIFAIAQFGMLVDIATPGNNPGLDASGDFIDPHTQRFILLTPRTGTTGSKNPGYPKQ